MNGDHTLLDALELRVFKYVVPSGNWIQDLDRIMKKHVLRMKQKCGYDGCKLFYLLRAIRNEAHHFYDDTTIYGETAEERKKRQDILGHPDGEFLHYWSNRFPNLLFYVHTFMNFKKDEPQFRKFYIYEEFSGID